MRLVWRAIYSGIGLWLISLPGFAGFIPENKSSIETVVYHVSATGNDNNNGSLQNPFKTLERAQRAVRTHNNSANVVVELSDGIYRQVKPLRFTTMDGGQHGASVTWKAAADAHPIIAGSMRVTGWSVFNPEKNIYVASIPAGIDARQIWVDDHLITPAFIELDRSLITFNSEGLVLQDAKYDFLSSLPSQDRLEIQSTGWFTNRIVPVKQITGRTLRMQQPAWDNNTWGYDTLNAPVGAETARLFLANSLSFLTQSQHFYIDPKAGKLYYIPASGINPELQDIELPRLQYLVSIGGSYEHPVHDLSFVGIQFSYTSWNFPSSNEGYADQQSGAFIAGISTTRPKDAIDSCRWGCRGFEARRNDWRQMPAAIQVAAAEHVVFDQTIFAHLGQVALGIGNNDDANASGMGLGARSIDVKRSDFHDLGGGAILAGGISRDAHHPADLRKANRDIVIANNRIHDVSEVYKDNSAILSTYVDGAVIVHNDIYNAPYDGIDIGWGWGMNDVGGNPVYRGQRGYYDFPQNPTYETPTLHRRVVVAYNRIHDIKKLFHDGGAIYNLSASPDTLIAENYIYNIPDRVGLYLDEGSRYLTVRNNVIDGAGVWFFVNTLSDAAPRRASTDNRIVKNWHAGGKTSSAASTYNNNELNDNTEVIDQQWPAEAKAVMDNAGIKDDGENHQ